MARTLFRLNKKKTAVIDEDAAKLCSEFAKLNSKQLLLVVLYCDYASPYNQLPEKDRMLRAKRQAFGTSECEPESEKIVRDAMDAYMSLQYDPLREQLMNCREKITQISRLMLAESDFRVITKMDEALDTLNNRIDKIEKKMKEQDSQDQVELKGGQTMSFLEQWHANRIEWERVNKKEEVE